MTDIVKPQLERYIRAIRDYPKPGIVFRDVTTLLADRYGLRASVDALLWPFIKEDIAYVAGIEARGFILGGAVAHQLGRGFIPIRKKGKLPGKVIGQDYELEYGIDTIEIHADAIRNGDPVLVIDDLVATGGTAEAAVALIERSGGRVVGAGFIIDLPFLGGAQRLRDRGVHVHTLVEFDRE